jgi:hypothetical protein
MLYSILVHTHSGLRWLVLAFLLGAIANAAIKMKRSTVFTPSDKFMALLPLIMVHIQLLIGVVLYILSPKVVFTTGMFGIRILRFFTVEHTILMILAITIVTIGYRKIKAAGSAAARFKTQLLFYSAGLIIILISIPWPFLNYGTGWF